MRVSRSASATVLECISTNASRAILRSPKRVTEEKGRMWRETSGLFLSADIMTQAMYAAVSRQKRKAWLGSRLVVVDLRRVSDSVIHFWLCTHSLMSVSESCIYSVKDCVAFCQVPSIHALICIKT